MRNVECQKHRFRLMFLTFNVPALFKGIEGCRWYDFQCLYCGQRERCAADKFWQLGEWWSA